MKCPHCGENFFSNWNSYNVHNVLGNQTGDNVRFQVCPSCNKTIIEINDRHIEPAENFVSVHPQGLNRGPISPHIPPHIAEDYREACNIAGLSPKAAAALARRCLQSLLDDRGYQHPKGLLVEQIKLFLGETDPSKIAPSSIRSVVDGIRHFGNFGAHPVNDTHTTSIIPVESEEVDWSLTIIERLFDFFYVQPAEDARRKAELDAKLAAAGKGPSQG